MTPSIRASSDRWLQVVLVRAALSRHPAWQLARQLGVHHEAVRNWIRQAEADAGEQHDRPTTDMAEENKRLRQQVAELRQANEILKAASACFAAELCAM